MKNVRAHISVKGVVQGVCFRSNVHAVALRQGVSGWVRNMYDGSVEATLEGDEGAVKHVIEWCHKGPSGAVVKEVTVSWQDYLGEFAGFTIAM